MQVLVGTVETQQLPGGIFLKLSLSAMGIHLERDKTAPDQKPKENYMKRLWLLALGTVLIALLAFALTVKAPAETLPPGQVDFGTFTAPSGGGEFVEVNVTSNLISFAARIIQKEEPDVAELLNGLQQVRVTVVGMDEQNRSDLKERATKLRKDLSTKGWERIVEAQKDEKDVSVYLKNGKNNAVQGLAVVVLDGSRQAVFVNIVGEIRPEQIALIGEKLHIDPLKKIGEATEK